MNPEIATGRIGNQVSREKATSGRASRSWAQCLPLINIKRRPRNLPADVVVYVWGGLIASGAFIVDLDNPYALVGYNPRAMWLWRPLLAIVLRSDRCREIRCMSEACRHSLQALFGRAVAAKAKVVYPRIDRCVEAVERLAPDGPRLLFIGTQFDIKGGAALLRAFRKVQAVVPGAKLDVITHLPPRYGSLAQQPGLSIHAASFRREEIWHRFMARADVLVHPTYVESFGMVVLEALAHGLAVVSTDVYAMREMVIDGENGRLLKPPIGYWEDGRAGPLFRRFARASEIVSLLDTREFEQALAEALISLIAIPKKLLQARQRSIDVFEQRFAHTPNR